MGFDLRRFMVRRKVFTVMGASFHVYDPDLRVVAFSRQKAFKLKEDIRVFTDESKATELLSIQARQLVDFSAAYDIVDSGEARKVGAARRKGWSSILRDSWELLDENDRPIAQLREDSAFKALLRRFLSNLIPQRYELVSTEGEELAAYRVRFNPFVYKLEVSVTGDIDPRLSLGLAVLLAAIEGRQK
jgi:hypothetical protein